MGKKYIIELLDDCPSEFKGIIVFGLTPEGQISAEPIPVEDLTPYTEPHTAYWNEYKRGYETAKHECEDCTKGGKYTADDAFQKGYDAALDDLWEAMQKAIKMYCEIDNEVYLRVFYDVNSDWGESVLQALFKKTPQQLIDSMRKYEESKEKHTWICSEVNEPSVDTTLICSECGYTITIKPGDTQALNFCPKCGDNKNMGDNK